MLALTLAFGCAIGIAVQAQETKTKTEVKGAQPQMVSYTGCLQTGTESRTYILDKVVPLSQTTTAETTGTSGVVTRTETRYALVPGEKVELTEHVGHKVEVTGMLIPAGESKTKTETKIEREHGKDTKITEKAKSDSDLPRFHVVSVKQLAESCGN
jgi:hypothetical protein